MGTRTIRTSKKYHWVYNIVKFYTTVVILGILDNVVQFLDVEFWSYTYSYAMYLCFFTGRW